MTGADSGPDVEPLVGVVGAEAADLEGLASAVDDVGGQLASGRPERLLGREPSVLLAVGDDALAAIARCERNEGRDGVPPVLPVGRIDGVRSVPAARAPAALRGAFAGERAERTYPTLAVAVDDAGDGFAGESATNAFFDVTLVTSEPARISEYAVRTGGESIDRFRADGVVVATAAGSQGYASAAGGPTLTEAVDAVVVAPIAPFVTERDQWVVAPAGLSLTVERDETAVSLQADERVIDTVDAGKTVAIEPGPPISVLTTEHSSGPFD